MFKSGLVPTMTPPGGETSFNEGLLYDSVKPWTSTEIDILTLRYLVEGDTSEHTSVLCYRVFARQSYGFKSLSLVLPFLLQRTGPCFEQTVSLPHN